VSNQPYSSYETHLDAQGALSLQVLDNNDGSHTIQGFQDNLTIESHSNDVITGGGSGETFVFGDHFGRSTLTDFAQHLTGAGHDSVVLPRSEFSDFSAVVAQTQMVGGDAVISSASGDQLTLLGVTKPTLATLATNFSFS
jgi:hypothetical protein